MNSVGLANIVFPVFKLGKIKPMQEHGISFYLLGRDIEYSDAQYQILVVDDKNLPEPTLALRRLKLKCTDAHLFNLKQAIFFIGDLIKIAKNSIWFIDSSGLIFQYEKSRRVPLVYKPIKKITNIVTGGAIVEVVGLSERFKLLFAPKDDEKYAGLLVLDRAHLLYGLYDKEYKNTMRAI
jgi:hypothetical protein